MEMGKKAVKSHDSIVKYHQIPPLETLIHPPKACSRRPRGPQPRGPGRIHHRDLPPAPKNQHELRNYALRVKKAQKQYPQKATERSTPQ
jgi:hypothetical protein